MRTKRGRERDEPRERDAPTSAHLSSRQEPAKATAGIRQKPLPDFPKTLWVFLRICRVVDFGEFDAWAFLPAAAADSRGGSGRGGWMV
ncbi:hypothetical protein SLA2020_366940 [Shorea laevis]